MFAVQTYIFAKILFIHQLFYANIAEMCLLIRNEDLFYE